MQNRLCFICFFLPRMHLLLTHVTQTYTNGRLISGNERSIPGVTGEASRRRIWAWILTYLLMLRKGKYRIFLKNQVLIPTFYNVFLKNRVLPPKNVRNIK